MIRKIFLLSCFAMLVVSAFLFKNEFSFLNKISGSQIKENEEEISGPSGSYESMHFINDMRSYPDADIPQDKYFAAFKYSQERMHQLSPSEDRAPAPWRSLGPNNIGGRSLSVAVNPADTSTLYIGSASGGLWKSTSGGLGSSAWNYVETGFPVQAVGTIAIDQNNPNNLYIGTGENYGYQASLNGLDNRLTRGMYGIGILKSTNAGLNWTKSLDWTYQSQTGVWKILINPKNSSILYAGTSEGVYKSSNSGSTWNLMLNFKMVVDMEIDAVDTNVVYASIGDLTNISPLPNVGIYKTTDSGLNWVKLTGGLPATWTGKTTIELYKNNPKIIYASVANDLSYVGLYKSTNAGVNWTVGSTTVNTSNQGWYNNGLFVKSNDSTQVLIGTLNVERSTNSGSSFSTRSDWSAWNTGAVNPGDPEGPSNFVHADVHYFASNPLDPNKIYIIADGGLYRSNDFGGTFYSCNGGFVTSQFYNSFANSYQDSNFALGGLQDNRSGLYQANPNNAFYKTFVGDGFWCGVNSANDNIVYTEYSYGDINQSVNRGLSWSDIGMPGSGNASSFAFSAPFVVCRSNSNVIYGGGLGIYKSTTGSGSWNGPFGAATFNNMKVLSIAVSNKSTDTLYCGTIPGASAGGIYRSFNGGANWTNVTGALPQKYPIDMNVNQNNVNEVFVTYGGFGNGHVFRSTNAGTNWTDISSGLPDVPTESVVTDPLYPTNIYVGNDLGVYVSTNSGSTWNLFSTGMPTAMIFDLSISYPNRKLRAATYGNGIWERLLVQNPVSVSNISTGIPDGFRLYQNFPNPFNPSTNIRFDILKNSNIKIRVYNSQGKEIEQLVNTELNAGSYEIMWNATSVPSGVYFYIMESAGKIVESKKMLLVK
ncbi:hypothetical protein BH10BAC5_BH10BAC5_05800 [soil metagenome]